jgi:hypothetical protein
LRGILRKYWGRQDESERNREDGAFCHFNFLQGGEWEDPLLRLLSALLDCEQRQVFHIVASSPAIDFEAPVHLVYPTYNQFRCQMLPSGCGTISLLVSVYYGVPLDLGSNFVFL